MCISKRHILMTDWFILKRGDKYVYKSLGGKRLVVCKVGRRNS
jgi:hypothetical protein